MYQCNINPGIRILFVFVALYLFNSPVFSQEQQELGQRRVDFYRNLSYNAGVDDYLDDSLSYGHSNGWIETKTDLLNNLGKKLVYHSISERDVRITINGDVAYARFDGDFEVSLDGVKNTFKLSVLEVWVYRDNKWRIFARQAVKQP